MNGLFPQYTVCFADGDLTYLFSGAIVGIVLGALAVLLSLLAVIIVLFRSRFEEYILCDLQYRIVTFMLIFKTYIFEIVQGPIFLSIENSRALEKLVA